MTFKLKSMALALVMTSTLTISAVQASNSEVQASNEEIGGLDNNLTGLKLKDQSAPSNLEMTFLQQLLDKKNKEIAELNKKIEELSINNIKLQEESITKNWQLDDKNWQLELNQETLQHNRMVFTEQTEKFDDLKDKMNKLTLENNQEIKKLKNELRNSKTCIEDQDLKIFELKFELNTVEKINNYNNEEIDKLKFTIKNLRDKQFQEKEKIIDELTNEYNNEMDKMNTLLQTKQETINKLGLNNDKLESQVTDLRNENSFLGRKIGEWFKQTQYEQFWLQPEFQYALTKIPEDQGQGQQNQGFYGWLHQQLPN